MLFWGKGKARESEPDAAFHDWRMSMDAFLTSQVGAKSTQSLHDNCLLRLKDLSRTSPLIVFLAQHLSMLDPVFDQPDPSPSPFLPIAVHCLPCKDLIASAMTDEGVVICENHITNKSHYREALALEMMKEWDTRRFRVNMDDLRHQACVEIRARTLSGSCRLGRELSLGNFLHRAMQGTPWSEWGIVKGHPLCIRRQTIAALMLNPKCTSRDQAEAAFDEVFTSCYNDTRPFDEIYLGR